MPMRVRLSVPLGAVLVALTLLCVGSLPPAAGPAWAADTNPNAQRKGSGLPIPRFASLKSDEVNVRTGPGSRYPIDWVFKRKGMPVEIVAEFENWRKIRDWQGAGGWVTIRPWATSATSTCTCRSARIAAATATS